MQQQLQRSRGRFRYVWTAAHLASDPAKPAQGTDDIGPAEDARGSQADPAAVRPQARTHQGLGAEPTALGLHQQYVLPADGRHPAGEAEQVSDAESTGQVSIECRGITPIGGTKLERTRVWMSESESV